MKEVNIGNPSFAAFPEIDSVIGIRFLFVGSSAPVDAGMNPTTVYRAHLFGVGSLSTESYTNLSFGEPYGHRRVDIHLYLYLSAIFVRFE